MKKTKKALEALRRFRAKKLCVFGSAARTRLGQPVCVFGNDETWNRKKREEVPAAFDKESLYKGGEFYGTTKFIGKKSEKESKCHALLVLSLLLDRNYRRAGLHVRRRWTTHPCLPGR